MGDPAGIGGEIILKAQKKIGRKTIPVVIGDYALLKSMASRLGEKGGDLGFRRFREGEPGDVEILDTGLLNQVEYGLTSAEYGNASYRYIMEALKLLSLGEVVAVVTCPISKKSIHLAGIDFPGHTELFAHYGGVKDYVMMMASPKLRVSLVTIHIPLSRVPESITEAAVFKTISVTHDSLRDYFRIHRPFIKVCGLNPHAGEEGVLGSEEGERIDGAIETARSRGMHVEGPFAADSLFHLRDCDAFVAMYHDQGLIPVKTLDFRRTVNITLGLPFIRTSVGHGTGFDIAGRGVADPTSLIAAYTRAEQMLFSSKGT
jgi:4-hydroxythreonine-4-phosphate dehydrogenase